MRASLATLHISSMATWKSAESCSVYVRALLIPVGCESPVEAADLTGSPVRMDYAFACGLVVLSLRLIADPVGLLFVPRLYGPVEGLGEVAKTGPDAPVVGATHDAL